MPVCVTGMHRSGTSMVANLLHRCGLHLGEEEELIGPSAHNTRGYWENRRFLEINEEILRHSGGGWDMPPEVRIEGGLSEVYGALKAKAEQTAMALRHQPVWGWKDPRTCLTMPFWKALFPEMTVLVCVRNPLEVVFSLSRRGSTSKALGLRLWRIYNQRLLDEIPPERRIVTHYDAFFSNPPGELRRIVDYLGLHVTDETVDRACRAVTNSCRNHRADRSELLKVDVPSDVTGLYDRLCAEAGLVYERMAEKEGWAFEREDQDGLAIARAELRERADRLEPTRTGATESLLELGETCFHCGLYDSAKRLFEQALRSGAYDCEALNNLGVLYFHLSDFRTAKSFFLRALENDPDHGEARFNLGQVPDVPEDDKTNRSCVREEVLSDTRLDQLKRKHGYPFRVDLGCGEKPAPGYLGIDRLELDCVDIVCDVTRGIPLPDASVQEIRAIHFFEHIPRADINRLVDEIFRILVPGGSLFMRLPYYSHRTAYYSSHLTFWNEDYCENMFIDSHGFENPGVDFKYTPEIQDPNNPFHLIFKQNPDWCRIHLSNVVQEVHYACRKPTEASGG